MKGCKDCPAYAKCTAIYRSSACDALRSTYGLNSDPEVLTNADRLRAMSDDELSEQLVIYVDGLQPCRMYLSAPTGKIYLSRVEAVKATKDWIQQPAEED